MVLVADGWTSPMKITLEQLATISVLTGLSVVIFVMLIPDVLGGVQEARTGMAYSDVRSLQDKFAGEAPREPTELEQRDPWGNAYVVQAEDDGGVRVTAAGPNGVFDSTAAGSDDIWSDMPTSPLGPFHTQRRWGWVRAFSVGFGAWIAFMAAYFWSERTARKHPGC